MLRTKGRNMGFFTRIKNMIKDRNPTETVVKLVRESGNGVYTWNGELLDYADIRAMVRPFTQAAGKFDAKHIRETVDKNGEKDIKVTFNAGEISPLHLKYFCTYSK